MRKIEEKMVNAIMNGKNFRQANTEVKVFDKHTNVLLHGNLIAQIDTTKNPYIMKVDHCGWDSVTTKSRLNALGCRIIQHNWHWYNEDKEGFYTDFMNGQQVEFLDGKIF